MTGLVFDRALDAVPGRADVIGHHLRRVLAPNPGPFTFLGTGTYLVGAGEVAVIDPGPADAAHIEAILAACPGERITHIVVTHTHADHSPGAALLHERTGAIVVGCAPHPDEAPDPDDPSNGPDPFADIPLPAGDAGEGPKESVDRAYAPDHLLLDGDAIDGPGWRLEAVHTPGHIANHVCFAWPDQGILFSGDHVMRWSTSVISPPTGDLRAYLASLRKVADRDEHTYWPTHGPAVRDPHQYVPGLIAHREQRTRQIVDVLAAAPATIREIVGACYPGLDERLMRAAGRSTFAHLLALRDDGWVASFRDDQPLARWRLTAHA